MLPGEYDVGTDLEARPGDIDSDEQEETPDLSFGLFHNCPKAKDHDKFNVARTLVLEDLPAAIRSLAMLNIVKQTVELTVRLIVSHTSPLRGRRGQQCHKVSIGGDRRNGTELMKR